MDSNFKALHTLIDTKMQFHKPESIGSGGFAPIGGDNDWEPVASAAFLASPHTAHGGPSLSQRFGATSPTGSFRGCNVDLEAVDEVGSGGRRSPIMSLPLGG